jgi:DNA polymerase III subunit beta
MRFEIPKDTLLSLVQTVSKAVAVRTTKQVLTGILLEVTFDSLTATAYDLELGIQDRVPVTEESGLKVHQEGSIVLPARYFSEVIRKLPSQNVFIQVNNNYMTEITSGSAQFHLHGIDAAEFPKLPVFRNAQAIELTGQTLKELIVSTAFATSTSEVRPVLTGIHLTYKGQVLTFTATDGLRLATRSISIPSDSVHELSAVIPGKSLMELAKIIPDREVKVSMQFSESHSLFAIESMQFYTRLIDGTYPDTSRIIPTSFKTEVVVGLEDFIGAIDRAALIARDRDNHMVRLEVTQNAMMVSSSSPEVGNVSENILIHNMTGDELSIAFNAKYVLDALKASHSEEVSVRFNGSNHPFVIRQTDNLEQGLQLISPVLMR